MTYYTISKTDKSSDHTFLGYHILPDHLRPMLLITDELYSSATAMLHSDDTLHEYGTKATRL